MIRYFDRPSEQRIVTEVYSALLNEWQELPFIWEPHRWNIKRPKVNQAAFDNMMRKANLYDKLHGISSDKVHAGEYFKSEQYRESQRRNKRMWIK